MLYHYPRNKPDAISAEVGAISELCDGKHHNLVRLFGFGPLKDGWFYIDMELCDFTLTDYIYSDKKMVDVLPCFDSLESRSKVQKIWDVMMQIADGVTFIHEKKYVHRDLKPNNSDSR
jgi:serine/threonine protein kinase